ncbi:MAG: hypothetical protein HYS08_05070 [Chlamydiae bacterium]|nr:hypothetical protein [Chlamydiota bacterium]MBI3267123.1 hypothetical protein [Chlamydiota bacterium]
MKRLLYLLVLLVSMPPLSQAEETLQPTFDGRPWKMGYQAHDESQNITEYVLEGETVDNWTELVTVHQFKNLQNKTTLKELMERMQSDLYRACPATRWEILNETPEDIVYTWQLKNCPDDEDQYEVARLILGKSAIYLIRYTHKASKIDRERYTVWLNLLADVKLSTPNDLAPVDYSKESALKSTKAQSEKP